MKLKVLGIGVTAERGVWKPRFYLSYCSFRLTARMEVLDPKGVFSMNTMTLVFKVLIPVDPPTSSTPHPRPHLPLNSRLQYWYMSHLRSTYSLGILLFLSLPDVNSWLLTFGFQLHNVIPGYPKPDMDAMEPSYELIHTQMKTQEWDNSKVIHAHGCPPQGTIQTFQEQVLPAFQEGLGH